MKRLSIILIVLLIILLLFFILDFYILTLNISSDSEDLIFNTEDVIVKKNEDGSEFYEFNIEFQLGITSKWKINGKYKYEDNHFRLIKLDDVEFRHFYLFGLKSSKTSYKKVEESKRFITFERKFIYSYFFFEKEFKLRISIEPNDYFIMFYILKE